MRKIVLTLIFSVISVISSIVALFQYSHNQITVETYATHYVRQCADSQTEPVAEPVTVEPVKTYQASGCENGYDLWLLAHLINGECGAEYCKDEMLYYVGSVVLNRVESEYFPDTIADVIYADGQYACVTDGNFDLEPSERCWRIASELLENGSQLPKTVVFQAEFTQGDGVYCQVQNMYFCFVEEV